MNICLKSHYLWNINMLRKNHKSKLNAVEVISLSVCAKIRKERVQNVWVLIAYWLNVHIELMRWFMKMGNGSRGKPEWESLN